MFWNKIHILRSSFAKFIKYYYFNNSQWFARWERNIVYGTPFCYSILYIELRKIASKAFLIKKPQLFPKTHSLATEGFVIFKNLD